MTFKKLSEKQKQIFKWCYSDTYKAIICDGAVRSGKTICMITSFVLWAMRNFNGAIFGICGKTVQSAERNIIMPLQTIVDIKAYFKVSYTRSVHMLTIEGNGHKNSFYVFGGKDESSYMLIQGITLSGVLFDEVALMPESFVNQAIARTLSVEQSKLWFNCNPDNPQHWFYKEWIQNCNNKNALHLHFLMSDNPILSKQQISQAEQMYSGVFKKRYIEGLWIVASGLVYQNYNDNIENKLYRGSDRIDGQFYISIDYGTINPFSMGLWCVRDKEAIRLKEFYHNSRVANYQMTDEEYYQKLEDFAKGYVINKIIVDPSAASFIECIRRHRKFSVWDADNAVIDGIRNTSAMLDSGRVKISENCKDSIREFGLYSWDEKSNSDKVLKENDHAMDDIRYFVQTILIRKFRWNF